MAKAVYLLLLLLTLPVYAEVWRDDFNDENLSGWTLLGERSVWKVEDGILRVELRINSKTPDPEMLQFTAIPGPYRRIRIVATGIGERGGGFGIALGKFFPEIEKPNLCSYIFINWIIYPWRIDGKGGWGRFPWPPRCPRKVLKYKERNQMDLLFEEGYFRLIMNKELQAEFTDPHFDYLDVVGLLIVGANLSQGWIDSFEISELTVAVEPEGKLTTTWGEMKGK